MGKKIKLIKSKKYDDGFIQAISNNSHELFHSNLWAWLIEKDHKFAECFFDNIKIDKISIINREKKNLDLRIELDDKSVYIIENKFKSIPTVEQLKKYVDKNKNDNVKEYVLVAPFSGMNITKETNKELRGKKAEWKFKEYKYILGKIQTICKQSKSSEIKKYSKVINEYCIYYINFISKVNSNIIKIDKYYFIKNIDNENTKIDKKIKNLQELNADDIINKQICSVFFNKFKKYLKKDIDKYEVTTDFRNKNFIMTIKKKNNNATYKPYIQIQGYQYRYFISLPIDEAEQNRLKMKRGKKQIKNKEDIKAIEKYLKPYIDKKWFSYDVLEEKKVHNQSTKMTVLFGKYAGGKSYDIYQYYNIEQETDYKVIFSNIVNDLNNGSKIK